MGTEDKVLSLKKSNCSSCGVEYVSYQHIGCDDSHEDYEQGYECPLCSYTEAQKRDFARRRHNPFMVAEIPRLNMDLILDDLMRRTQRIPSPIGWPEADWRKHLPERFKKKFEASK